MKRIGSYAGRWTLTILAGVFLLTAGSWRGAAGRPSTQGGATKSASSSDTESSTLLRVAIAQIPVTRSIPSNIETISRAIDFAFAEKADILLTPEGSLSGYTHAFDRTQVEQGLRRLVAKASSGQLALALGTCYVEPDDGRCYNQIRFYDGNGAFLGFHSKILLTGSRKDPAKGEINNFATSSIRTFEIKGITVGGLICNDLWANPGSTLMPDPHLTQQLSEKGARIVFQAINGGRNGSDWSRGPVWAFHESNLQLRARAGKLWIVSADNCFPTNIPCSAPSGVLRPDGSWALKASSQGEQLLVYTIQLD